MKPRPVIGFGLGLTAISVFLYNAHRRFFLCDDAFISFRYAERLSDGLGLTWNLGERVEGYSNFLWVLLLAAGHKLGLAPEDTAPMLSILSGALAILILPRLFGSSFRATFADPWAWLPSLALAVHPSWTAWGTGGLETTFFIVLLLASTVRWTIEREDLSRRPWISSIGLAAAAWTRPEGPLFAACIGFIMLADVWLKRTSLRRAGIWAGAFACLTGAHFVGRYLYYGSWLPNTFYAKVVGWQADRGLEFLTYYLELHRQWAILLLLPFGWWLRPSARVALASLWVVFYTGYLVSIGGGFLELRLLMPVLPWAFFIAAEGLKGIYAKHPGLTTVASLGALALVFTSAIRPPLEQRPEAVEGLEPLGFISYYGELRTQQGQWVRELIDQGVLPADLVVSTGGAGALPYFSRWTVVDYLGLNDFHVARQDRTKAGKVGHQHRAGLDYLSSRGVSLVITQLRLVFEAGTDPAVPWRRQLMDNRHYEELVAESSLRLRAECFQLPDQRFMVFATFLSADQIEARLAPLERCSPLPEPPPAS